MTIDAAAVRERLKRTELRELFNDLGWENFHGTLDIADGTDLYRLEGIAEKRGVQVFRCPPRADGTVPGRDVRAKIDTQLRKFAHEHLIIFTNLGTPPTQQVWQWAEREPGKPRAIREHAYHVSQPGDSLVQKLEGISFSISEEEELTLAGHVIRRIHESFGARDRVTKKFYERFQQEHTRFLAFIQGITEQDDREWYASVMLNRLMFIYFVQKKGFLDGDPNYLRNRLAEVRRSRGSGQFFSFYKVFLRRLFHEGLAHPVPRGQELDHLLGTVPYLNGGIFDVHKLEEENAGIDIADDAFEAIFDFFDAYEWHLDTRPLRNDREINPDVLGYIFEKYINQKQMGAYYTKEDITGYISQNTVVPFLLDATKDGCRVAFEPGGPVWRLLRDDPDRYIYDAVRKGVDEQLPPEIETGIHNISARGGWNRPADAQFALLTETWREHMARRTRCFELRRKLAAGEVAEVNDLITLNLNVRQFAQDVIEHSEGPDVVRAFYQAITKVSILDPTCGSGAFLFAALNILQPLYDACLDRMEAWIEDEERLGRPPGRDHGFRRLLEQVAKHPNREYFVLKSIIIDNLYGVDIMEEAVEICKLRLFLKLVAQVGDAARIEPLPDIDFNIRTGNTLVGFTSLEAVREAMGVDSRGNGRLLFAEEEAELQGVEESASLAARAYQVFRDQQTEFGGSITPADKLALRERLDDLGRWLDRHLARQHGTEPDDSVAFERWRDIHRPLHWFVEFYSVIHQGGFSAIIGNPPYVEVPREVSRSFLRRTYRTALPVWSRDEDLYTMVVERSLSLGHKSMRFGMILPLSMAFSTKAPYVALRRFMTSERGRWWTAHFDRIPSALFGNDVRIRCTIAIFGRELSANQTSFSTTSLQRWEQGGRDVLFPALRYSRLEADIIDGLPKVDSQRQADGLHSLLSIGGTLAGDLENSISFGRLEAMAPHFPTDAVFVGGTAYNWFPCWREIPETTDERGTPSLPSRTIGFLYPTTADADIVFALLCSSLGYWWWAVASDGFNLKRWLVDTFPVSARLLPADARRELATAGGALRTALRRHYVYKENRGRKGNFHLPSCQAEVLVIDSVLAQHIPGLSEEFFEDVRAFSARFSRVSGATDEDTTDTE